MSERSAVQPLRIAVVIESFDPMAGGNERSTDQIIAELVRRGHEVTLITGYAAPGCGLAEVKVMAMATRKSSGVQRLWKFHRWAKQRLAEGGFDTSVSMTMAVPARVVQPRGGTVRETLARNVARQNGIVKRAAKKLTYAVEPKQRLLLRLERKTLADRGVYRVSAVSRYVVGQLETHYQYPAERTVLIPNAAVMPSFELEQREVQRKAVREQHGIAEGAFVLLLAAHNPALKGYATLLAALNILRSQGTVPVALLVGGFGPKQRAQAERLGLADQIRIAGAVPEISAMYAASDVTVLPSWYDPSSKVVLESLMMATPVVSTVYNGASDHIEPAGRPPRGCVLNHPGDAEQLADAIQRLSNKAFRAECAAACAGLDWELGMARHVDELERVLAAAARKTARFESTVNLGYTARLD